jgi:hypothetical protein
MSENFTGTAAWKRIRLQVLERDGYICRIRGPHCQGKATAVDHIIPMADGGALYDPANLRAACAWCNNWRAVRQKHQDGWRRARTRITLVVGPPGSETSDYIRDHAGPQDLVVDYEAMAAAMHGASHQEISAVHNALLGRVRRGEVDSDRVWIRSSNPKAESIFPFHEVITVGAVREPQGRVW